MWTGFLEFFFPHLTPLARRHLDTLVGLTGGVIVAVAYPNSSVYHLHPATSVQRRSVRSLFDTSIDLFLLPDPFFVYMFSFIVV